MRRRIAAAATAMLLALMLTACSSSASGSGNSSGSGGSGSSSGGSSGGNSGGSVGGVQLSSSSNEKGGTVSGGGTTGGAVGDMRDYSCEMRFQPVDSGIIKGASIKATVQVRCAAPPQRHHMEVHLQRRVSGNWSDQGLNYYDDIPDNSAFPKPRITSAPCVPGSWRVLVEVYGAAASGKGFGIPNPVQHVGSTVEISPHDCG